MEDLAARKTYTFTTIVDVIPYPYISVSSSLNLTVFTYHESYQLKAPEYADALTIILNGSKS